MANDTLPTDDQVAAAEALLRRRSEMLEQNATQRLADLVRSQPLIDFRNAIDEIVRDMSPSNEIIAHIGALRAGFNGLNNVMPITVPSPVVAAPV